MAGDGVSFETFVVLRRDNQALKTQLAEIKQVKLQTNRQTHTERERERERERVVERFTRLPLKTGELMLRTTTRNIDKA